MEDGQLSSVERPRSNVFDPCGEGALSKTMYRYLLEGTRQILLNVLYDLDHIVYGTIVEKDEAAESTTPSKDQERCTARHALAIPTYRPFRARS
jgi:hypothetical protein